MNGDLATRSAGPAAHRAPTARSGIRRWVVTGLAGVGFVLAALVVSAYFGAAFGVQTALLALAVALIPRRRRHPGLPLARPLRVRAEPLPAGGLPLGRPRRRDRRGRDEHERHRRPRGGLRPRRRARDDGRRRRARRRGGEQGAARPARLVVPRREFDGITDGMVYAGVTAAGFAFTENIQYLATAYTEGGGEALTATFVARCLLSPFAHPMFTVLTGVGIGRRRDEPDLAAAAARPGRRVRPRRPRRTRCGTSRRSRAGRASSSSTSSSRCRSSSPSSAFVVWTRRHEGHLIGQFLRPYSDAGWLSPGEVDDARVDDPPPGGPRSGPGRTPAARGSPRCAPSRTPPASSRSCAAGCTTTPPTPTRSSRSASSSHALTARRAEFVGLPVT